MRRGVENLVENPGQHVALERDARNVAATLNPTGEVGKFQDARLALHRRVDNPLRRLGTGDLTFEVLGDRLGQCRGVVRGRVGLFRRSECAD